MRNLAHEAQDVRFDKEGQINQPGIWGTELFFSAGSGSLDDPVLTRLYLYNLTTNKAQKVKETEIYKGEYYETLINDKWLIYLETDHGTNNYIYAMNRADSKVTLIKNCKNGKPKLRAVRRYAYLDGAGPAGRQALYGGSGEPGEPAAFHLQRCGDLRHVCPQHIWRMDRVVGPGSGAGQRGYGNQRHLLYQPG